MKFLSSLLLFTLLLSFNTFAQDTNDVQLTQDEKIWLEKHPNIVLGADQNWQPFDFKNSLGNHDGFNSDFIELLRKKLGVDIKVELGVWSELQQKVKDKKLAGLVGPSKTDERDKYMEFTKPYYLLAQVILVRKDASSLASLNDLDNKTLALKLGSSDITYFQKKYPKIKQKIYNTNAEIIRAVSLGEVDAGVSNIGAASYEMERNFISNIKVGYDIAELSGDMRFGIRKDWPQLATILQKGIDSITREEKNVILNEWLKLAVTDNQTKKIVFTQKEKEWLNKNQSIRLAYLNSWATDKENNNFHTEYVDLLSKYGNVNIIFVKYDAWKTAFESAKKGEDVFGILNLSWSKEREENSFDYTKAYYFTPLYLIVKKDNDSINSIEDLANKSVFLEEHAITNQIVKELNYNITPIVLQTEEDKHKELSKKDSKAEALLTYEENPELLEKYDLKIANKSFSKYGEVHIGTSKNQKELHSILNKIHEVIPKNELTRIQNKIYSKTNTKKLNLLTLQEEKWVENNTVKVGGEVDWPPFDFVSDGQYQGISKDIFELISKNTGLKVEYVTGRTWNELLNDFENGKLDIMPALYHTKKRDKFTIYTKPYLNVKDYAFVKEEDNSIKNINDLRNKKIAIIDGYALEVNLKEEFPDIKLLKVDSATQGIDAVLTSKADVYIDAYPTVMYLLANNAYAGLKAAFPVDFYSNELRIGIQKSQPILASIVQKGLESITPKEKRDIFKKWTATKEIELELTKEEKAWLDKNIPIKYVYDPSREPFEYKNDLNHHSGITAEILNLISQKSGIIFIPKITNNWDESVELIKTKQADMFSLVIENEERKNYLDLTQKTLYKIPIVFITKADNDTIYENLKFELKDKRIGIVKGRAVKKEIQKRFPEFNFITVDSVEDGFEKVSNGEIDMFAVNMATGKYYINVKGYSNTKIATKIDIYFEFKMAVQKYLPKEVLSIINKALDTIGEQKLNEIYNEYTEVKLKTETDWVLLFKIGGVVFLLFAFGFYSNRKLKSIVAKRTAELKSILESFDAHVIASNTDLKGRITYVSDAFCEISGYSREEMMGKPHNISRHPDMPKETFKDLWATIKSGKTWSGEVKNIKKDGGFYWVDAFVSPLYNAKKEIIGYSSIRHDITAKKEVEELSKNLEQKVDERTLELKEAQEQFTSMVSNVPGAIYRVIDDSAWPIIYMSDEIEKITGYPARDFIESKIVTFSTIMYPDDVEPIGKMIQEQFSNGRSFQVDYRVISKSGEIVWVRSQGQSVKTDNGDSFIDGVLIDITEEKELESQIRQNQEQMVFVSQYANLGFWTFNPQVGDLLVNDTFVQMLGYDANEVLTSGYEDKMFKPFKNGLAFWEQLLHPDDAKRTGEIITAHINGETPLYKVEYRMRKADGSWMWSMAIGRIAERDQEGKAIKFNGVNLDIQDAKDAQELISQNKLFLDTLLDSQEQIVITTDGIVLKSVNKTFLDFFEVTHMDEFTKDYACICDKFVLDETGTYLQKYMGEDTWIQYILKNGNKTHKAVILKNETKYIFSVTAAVMPIEDGTIKSAVFTDITELELQKQQSESILSSVLLPMLITSKATRKIVYANSFAESQYDIAFDKLIGLDIDTFYTSDNQRDSILKELNEKGMLKNFETKFKTAKGREFDAILSLVDIVFNGEGCYLGVATDISILKELQNELEKVHRHTRESIEYASLIQHALIPSNDLFRKYFSDYLTIWHPKDIVGGDIYLFEELRDDNECLLMVIDCTGHGVPGAFVTMLVKAIERQITSNIVNSDEVVSPAKILSIFNRSMKHLLKQESEDSISNAGFDGGIIYYNKKDKIIKFAGAETPLFWINEGELNIIKGNRQSVGYKKSDSQFEFQEHTIEVKQGMQFYLTTDGYLDQNGGEKGFPFGKKRFSKIITDNYKMPFADQQEILLYDMLEYRGDQEKNDDVTIVGIKI